MNNTLVPLGQAKAPAASRAAIAAGQGYTGNFADNIQESIPRLSIKGKEFTAIIDGVRKVLTNPTTGEVYQQLDVILVNSGKFIAKSYYIKGFNEGDANPPDCWSLDAIKPDPRVVNKVHPTCPDCPMNAFNSKPARAVDKVGPKACSDSKRIAIMMPHQLGHPNPTVLLLRVPQQSLKNMKGYVQLIERHGFQPNACVTRLSFQSGESFPKLLFNFAYGLDDGQYNTVKAVADSDQVDAMLRTPDFDNAPTPNEIQSNSMAGLAPQAPPIEVVTESEAVAPAEHVDELLATKAPPLQEVPSTVIELPEGKLFDTATGQYVERPQPKVEVAELDPSTLALPEGKFFNTVTRQYVTGPEKGAPIAMPPAQVTRERKPRGKAKEVKPGSTLDPVKDEPAKVETAPVKSKDNGDKPANGHGEEDAVRPVVSASVPELDEILNDLVAGQDQ
jgi:hypothetical protein